MRFPHPIALAIVGWMLLVPPIVRDANNEVTVDAAAPMNQWRTFETYDSQAQCEARRSAIQTGELNLPRSEKNADLKQKTAASLECVASDDPRLAK